MSVGAINSKSSSDLEHKVLNRDEGLGLVEVGAGLVGEDPILALISRTRSKGGVKRGSEQGGT